MLGDKKIMAIESLVRPVVMDFPEDVVRDFKARFENELEEFVVVMDSACDKWRDFDKITSNNIDLAHLSSLIYGALNLHAISMHLLISGFLIAAGNTQRQVLECIAMALLGSKPNLGYLKRYGEGKYSTNKSIDVVIKKHKLLNLNHDALKALKTGRDFYHHFSHPTMMTVASHISMSEPGNLYFGAAYDAAKLPQYRLEINSRLSLAKTFENFIEGTRSNVRAQGK